MNRYPDWYGPLEAVVWFLLALALVAIVVIGIGTWAGVL